MFGADKTTDGSATLVAKPSYIQLLYYKVSGFGVRSECPAETESGVSLECEREALVLVEAL